MTDRVDAERLARPRRRIVFAVAGAGEVPPAEDQLWIARRRFINALLDLSGIFDDGINSGARDVELRTWIMKRGLHLRSDWVRLVLEGIAAEWSTSPEKAASRSWFGFASEDALGLELLDEEPAGNAKELIRIRVDKNDDTHVPAAAGAPLNDEARVALTQIENAVDARFRALARAYLGDRWDAIAEDLAEYAERDPERQGARILTLDLAAKIGVPLPKARRGRPKKS